MIKSEEELIREAEVAELVRRAADPADEYDGHHGHDDSVASLDYALANDPVIAEKIMNRIMAGQAGV